MYTYMFKSVSSQNKFHSIFKNRVLSCLLSHTSLYWMLSMEMPWSFWETRERNIATCMPHSQLLIYWNGHLRHEWSHTEDLLHAIDFQNLSLHLILLYPIFTRGKSLSLVGKAHTPSYCLVLYFQNSSGLVHFPQSK